MTTYIVLLRGINVGGKNKVPMRELKQHLEELGFQDVMTYIQSGNVILKSRLGAQIITDKIEAMLPAKFKLDSSIIKILTLTAGQLQAIVDNKPKGFGDQPDLYYSDAVFLMGIDADTAMEVFDPKEGVDRVWKGEGVIYSERLGALRTKSRLNKIVGTPAYKSMTIRSWNTTIKLLGIIKDL
jgi:uncharacterized protein (DUF1697 family)